jgi:hypothetical protein
MQTREARSGSGFYLAQNHFDYKPGGGSCASAAFGIQH